LFDDVLVVRLLDLDLSLTSSLTAELVGVALLGGVRGRAAELVGVALRDGVRGRAAELVGVDVLGGACGAPSR
jgi:hypothetical protein